jgi:hypothetical protein
MKGIISSQIYQPQIPICPFAYKAKIPAIAAAAPTPMYCTNLSLFAAPVLLGAATLGLTLEGVTPAA